MNNFVKKRSAFALLTKYYSLYIIVIKFSF